MTTDSYYAIGKSHLVCQDVARHGDGETPFIIVRARKSGCRLNTATWGASR